MVARETIVVAAVCVAAVVIRLVPEVLLRGREPPALVRDALPWLPTLIAGTFIGVLHMEAPADGRPAFVLAALAAGATAVARRSFYLPLLAGAATLAGLRWLGWP